MRTLPSLMLLLLIYTGDGQVVRNGVLEMSRFPGGYFDANLKPHYYITDYQGNNVGVHDGVGTLEQRVDYYPFGEPWLEPEYTASGQENRYLFGDKERLFTGRANEYDFLARSYAAPYGRFTSVDPLAEKTPWLSPYAYCANNPVNCIDPDGKDIVILYSDDVVTGHLAMLIQDEIGKWQYYSVNGDNLYIPFTNFHFGGRKFNDVSVGAWNSPMEFFHSTYNVRNDESKDNINMNNYGFSEGYQISTTPEQDEIMRHTFAKIAQTGYNLFTNNCATAVQKSMVEAGIPVSEPNYIPSLIPVSTIFGIVEGFEGRKLDCNLKTVPRRAYESIQSWNPGGRYLHK